ncbi:carboxylic acid reductase [Actinokineospora bangkokensis]|uniref:Carboxylic acid reductase n=1 Tax=Actinokineospora bangkokensis TaxID=1193682 RepID=A0A1Q9LN36_9PSEU|nr:carboxylic acid reductase [Actinokineospora bangkokensis]OLR93452.1 oxidoreductase [Actinokineospora bangkokensis]
MTTVLSALREVGSPGGPRLRDVVGAAMAQHADRPALAERDVELVTDPATGRTAARLLPSFSTTTYARLWADAAAIAAQWHHDERDPLPPGGFVATLGFTSREYTTVDLAILIAGAVAVPLQANSPAEQLIPVVAEAEPLVLATSAERVGAAVRIALATGCVRRVVVFDHRPEVDDEREAVAEARRTLAEAGSQVRLSTLASVREAGAALPEVPAPAPDPGGDPDPLRLLIYTSGSTGAPKGAIYTERKVASLWAARWNDNTDPVTFHFMPMSHAAGRVALYGGLSMGGCGYFTARSDLSTLLEDMGLARPTEVLLVPRVCDMLFQRYQAELDRRPGEEEQVKAELRERVLGGRLTHAAVGTAPVAPELAAFLASVVGRPVFDAYGSTEAGMIIVEGYVMRPPVLDYKLVDVPELGYFTTDVPHPRGELLVKSAQQVPGYYKRPELTAEVFDEDGFYRTGDIMAQIGPDRLAYLDRRKNVLKLSQGEFVTVAVLEAAFDTHPAISQSYVYGNSERAYLLAVLVPSEQALAESGGDENALRALLAAALRQVAADRSFNSYEIPRDFLVEHTPFTTENGLLSDLRKLLRPRLKERYGDRLEQLYADLARAEVEELRELRRTAAERPVLETVRSAARALLGQPGAQISPDAHFTELGGDSLSALSFSTVLHETFGVPVPVGVVISPANDLRAIAAHIEAERASGGTRPTAASVHGAGATEVRAADLTLEKFLDADTLAAAAALPRPTGTPRTVLLTGANGYLGRFLCLEWLDRVAAVGGTVVCLVRGADAAAARARLESAFDSGDEALLERFRAVAADHLEVLAGDVADPDLGLPAGTWRRLAESVDLVVHPAALVNHVLPYDQLFGPNVVGTAELIRVTLTTRLKPLLYLSTVAVLDDPAIDEEADIRQASPVRALGSSYATGYAASKWAGEVLLREAHEAFGLPVRAFRSDMILAHTRYTGQLNVPDMFTRLLFSVLVTGLAPRSFHTGGGPAHYDGLPVDFTAKAISDLGAAPTDGYTTYNVLNPHADGIGLDTFVDWLVEAGHRVVRIEDHGQWVDRLTTALRGLPEQQRQRSLLPLMDAFAHPTPAVNSSVVPAPLFHAAVRATGSDIPHLTPALITKYADDLAALGLL